MVLLHFSSQIYFLPSICQTRSLDLSHLQIPGTNNNIALNGLRQLISFYILLFPHNVL